MVFLTATAAMLVARMVGAGTNPVEWLRAGIGAVAFAVLLIAKRGGFARAAFYAIAIEVAGGVALFMLVDVPLVLSHFADIVRAVAVVAPHGLP